MASVSRGRFFSSKVIDAAITVSSSVAILGAVGEEITISSFATCSWRSAGAFCAREPSLIGRAIDGDVTSGGGAIDGGSSFAWHSTGLALSGEAPLCEKF